MSDAGKAASEQSTLDLREKGARPRTEPKYPPTVGAECSIITSASGNTSDAAVTSRNASDRR